MEEVNQNDNLTDMEKILLENLPYHVIRIHTNVIYVHIKYS